MYVYVKNITSTPVCDGFEDHGLRDQKGRKIGYRWEIRLEKLEIMSAARAQEVGGCCMFGPERVGKPYRVWGSPTRNGQGYGPSFNHTYFASLDAAQKNVANRVKQARKRDAKRFIRENA